MSDPDDDADIRTEEPERKTKRDPTLRSAIRTVAITGLVLTVLGGVGFDLRTAIGVGLGALLATVNLILFVRLGEAFLAQQGKSAPWAALGGIKLLGLFAAVWLILRRGDVSALALVVGYGALPIGVTLGTLFRPKP